MADRYWISDVAANWNDTANWSTSSGGSGGASVPGSGDAAIFDAQGTGDCTLGASYSVASLDTTGYTGTLRLTNGATFGRTLTASGNITVGLGTSVVGGSASNGGFVVSGTFTNYGDCAATVNCDLGTGSFFVQNGTFAGSVSSQRNCSIRGTVGSCTLRSINSTGAYNITLTGDFAVTGSAAFGNIANGNGALVTAGYDVTFQGDVSLLGVFGWTKGTGTLTFSGAADQTVDLSDKTVEDIVINKSTTAAKVTFTDGWTSDSFTLTQGTVAFGSTGDTLTTTGNWTIGTAGQVDPTELDGWTWSVGGNLSLSGESGDLLNLAATAAWYLQVTGTATATYVTADYSDASGYTEIDADDGTNTDGGNNVNWAFAAAPAAARNLILGGGVF